VTGAIAVVRAWCSASAPIVTRVGHGGVLRVIDQLPGDGIDWYGIADERGALMGWMFASIVSPVQVDAAAPALSLVVETNAQRMTIYKGDRLMLTTPISTGRALAPGNYPVTEQTPVDSRVSDPIGAPWALAFGDSYSLSGAYWHNRFGEAMPGAAVQVTPPLAKWLYPRTAEVIIS
jgi:hypothetical protein